MTVLTKLFSLIFVNFAFCGFSCAKVTGKQYASMPELFYQDNYDKCMGLEDEALYCSFTYELEPLDPTNVSETWKIVHEVSSDIWNYRHDLLRHSICVPFTCPNAVKSKNDVTALRQDIAKCYNAKFENTGLKGHVTNLTCETNDSHYRVDGLDITVAIFFVSYVAFVLFASLYEGIYRYKTELQYNYMISTRWGRILAAFSLPNNWEKLKTVKNSADVEKMRPLQGVRLYNFFIVIWSHVSLFLSQTKVLNTTHLEKNSQRMIVVFLSTGSLSITTNFFMSTFLLTNSIFTHFENKKDITGKFILSAIIYRYLRLTPTMAAICLFNATWLRHLGSGPNWKSLTGVEYLRCKRYGWMNVLYINNMLRNIDMCIGQTWYLALDMQYFILLLPLICYMRKHTNIIWPTLACLLSINIVGTFIQNYIGNYEAFMLLKPELVYDFRIINENPQKEYQLSSFIGNLTGAIFGIGFGYIFYKYRNQKLFTSNVLYHEILYNIVSYGFSLGIIILPGIYFLIHHATYDPFVASLYVCLSRPVFILGIGYSIFAATQGIGWLTKYCVNWPPCYVLGRLVYSAYLIHGTILFISKGNLRGPNYISDFHIIHTLLGDIFLTFIAALLVNLFIESPASELQKLILLPKEKIKEVTKKE